MVDFLQTLITSIALGSLYALIALGYTLVYGILKFINFAHSDIVVLGAWVSYCLAKWLLPRIGQSEFPPAWWAGALVLMLAMATCALVGFMVERLAYKPLRAAPRLNVLITAIGVSLFLQSAGQMQFTITEGLALPFGAQPQGMPKLLESRSLAEIQLAAPGVDGTVRGEQQIVISLVDTVIVVTAAALIVGLQVLVYRTRLGMAMRAVSFNTQTAALMGIAVDRVISFTFVLGAALAAAAGFLYALKYETLQQTAHAAWVLLGLKAFVSAVVGGIGNLQGAMVGAFLIAFIEQFGARYISPNLKDVYVFAILILVLLIRPNGLFGRAAAEKV